MNERSLPPGQDAVKARHRFFVEKLPPKGTVEIQGSEAHHMVSVLRLKPPEKIILFDETGKECVAIIRRCGLEFAEVEIVEMIQSNQELPMRLALAQGILKGKKMDFLVQKCTELGVTEFIPVEFERCIARISEKAEAKREKWQRIAIEACKQCGRSKVMKVAEPVKFDAFLPRSAIYELRIACSPGESQTVKQLLKTVSIPRSLVVAVGPEGGPTGEEVKQAQRAGFMAASLGRSTLRAETASLAAVSMIIYEFAL